MPISTARPAPRPAAETHSSEVRRLATLLDTSQALTGTIDLKAGLHRVLEVLGRHHGAVRSSVVMLDDDTGQLRVEASDGLDNGYRVSYQLGEGITGRVVQSGKPIVVPQISREPMFLNRAAKRSELPQQELSFICVPIVLNRKSVGALGVDLRFKPDRDYDHKGIQEASGVTLHHHTSLPRISSRFRKYGEYKPKVRIQPR